MPTQKALHRHSAGRRGATAARFLANAALMSAPVAVLVTDLAARIVSVNPAFERMTGYMESEVLGKNPRLLQSGLHGPEFYENLWQTVSRGEPWTGEVVDRRRDGRLFTAELCITPVRDARGRIAHFVGFHRDVTEERALKILLTARIGELTRLNRQLDDVAGSVAAAVLRPLRGLRGAAEAACADGDGDATTWRGHLEAVVAQSRQLSERVSDLLRLHRASSERGIFVSLSLDRVMTEVRRTLEPELSRVGVVLDVDPLPGITGNRVLVEELLTGLIRDRVRAAPGPSRIQVFSGYAPDGAVKQVEVIVRREGVRIPPHERERMWMPFCVDRRRATADANIDLAVAARIAERHGGRVWADEAPDGSGQLHVQLPVRPERRGAGRRRRNEETNPCDAAPGCDAHDQDEPCPAREGDDEDAERDGRGKCGAGLRPGEHDAVAAVPSLDAGRAEERPIHALLACGNVIATEQIRDATHLVRGRRTELSVVGSIDAASRLADRGGHDLFLVGEDLADGDGLELVALLHERHPSVPVIVISATADERLGVFAMKLGATDYVTHDEVHSVLGRAVSAAVESARAAQEVERARGELVGIVAHDLKNPLANVASYTELLLESPDEPLSERMRILGRIRENCTFMFELIDDILDTRRIDSGLMKLIASRSNMVELVKTSVDRSAFLAREKGIELMSRLPDAPVSVTLDPGKIVQVLNNLISNAIKFSPSGSFVTITLTEEAGGVRVCVADSGPGIEPAEQGLLFKKFSRTSVRPAHGEKSTGLGLYVVHELVKLHRGRVWVESEPGHGARFMFWLPTSWPSDARSIASSGSKVENPDSQKGSSRASQTEPPPKRTR